MERLLPHHWWERLALRLLERLLPLLELLLPLLELLLPLLELIVAEAPDLHLVGVESALRRVEHLLVAWIVWAALSDGDIHPGDVLEVDDDASDAPPPLGYVCVLKSDGADGERVPLHATLKFGRALDNDVRVPVARCSRLHAELLTVGESEAVLQNHARAANTTVLRGVPLNPNQARDVKSGDVFEICGRRFRFEAAVAPAPAPPAAPAAPTVDVDLTGAPALALPPPRTESAARRSRRRLRYSRRAPPSA